MLNLAWMSACPLSCVFCSLDLCTEVIQYLNYCILLTVYVLFFDFRCEAIKIFFVYSLIVFVMLLRQWNKEENRAWSTSLNAAVWITQATGCCAYTVKPTDQSLCVCMYHLLLSRSVLSTQFILSPVSSLSLILSGPGWVLKSLNLKPFILPSKRQQQELAAAHTSTKTR